MNRRQQMTTPQGFSALHSHLRDVAPYSAGKFIEEVKREFGLSRVVKLASNENPLGPSPLAVRAMRAVTGAMNQYPDGGGYCLKQAIAQRHGVRPEEIVLGNGSDEITTLLARCYLGPGRSLVTSNYSFIRFAMVAQLVNARVRLAPMKRFRHDPDALAGAVDETTTLVCVDNPCNPTGSILTRSEMKRLLSRVPSRTVVHVDEAYCEFAQWDSQYPDTLALRAKHPNIILTRTFSKAYGLSGLRIGYGIASAEIIRDLERVRPPFNANRMAQVAALAALGDAGHLRRTLSNNAQGRQYLGAAFRGLGLKFEPSWANFFLVDISERYESGVRLYEDLLRQGVIVRDMGGYGLTQHVRISIGTPGENRKLVQTLKKLLKD